MSTLNSQTQSAALPTTPAALPNRWVIALCGVLIQMMLGTVYAWSEFKNPIFQSNHWDEFQVGLTFALTIFFLGFAAALGGRLVDKAGSRKIATIGGILFGLGTALAAVAHQFQNIYLLWLGYGVICGIGNGLGYITPVAVLTRWFPDKKGLITGMAVMGFGLGAAFMSLIAKSVIGETSTMGVNAAGKSVYLAAPGVYYIFYASAVVFLIGLPLAARWLVNPPAGYTVAAAVKKASTAPAVSLTLTEAKSRPQFYILWGILFFNVSAGIALLSNLKPMALSNVEKITQGLASAVVMAGSFCNGFGRIFWGALSEKIGRRNVFLLIFLTQIPLFIFLPQVTSFWTYTLMACWILLCYGGGFGTMPSFTADTFGAKNMGAIYGMVLFAWGVAGGVGPMLMEWIKKTTGTFNIALYIAASLLGAGLVLTLLYRKPKLS